MQNSVISSEMSQEQEKVIETAKKAMEYLKPYNLYNPRVFTIYGNRPEEIKDAFYKSKVSFLELKQKNKVLVEQKDYEKCSHLAETVYQKQKSFFQEYNAGELKDMIASHPKITDTQFLQIKGLSPVEMQRFLIKCDNIKPGLLVETALQPDNTYSVSIPYALLSQTNREEITKAYITSAIEAYGIGANARENKEFSKEAYNTVLKEHDFIREIVNAVTEKLNRAGLTGNEFREFFSSATRQSIYILSQLKAGDELEGFTQIEKENLKNAYSKLPSETYKDTVENMKAHKIISLDIEKPIQVQASIKPMAQEQEK